jgi:hypothetical protein
LMIRFLVRRRPVTSFLRFAPVQTSPRQLDRS